MVTRTPLRLLRLCALALLLTACAGQASHDTPYIPAGSERQAPNFNTGPLQQRLILLGDAGHSSLEPWQPSLAQASARASLAPQQTAVLLLGDNIYYKGFPHKDSDQEDFNEKQQALIERLDAQLKVARDSGAQTFVLPGNHDWYAKQVDDQAQYIADYAERERVAVRFEPYEKGQPPLPEVVHLNGVSIVFIDSMWLLQSSDKDLDVAMQRLDSLLDKTQRHYPDHVIVLSAHHPLETMGPHNHYYTSSIYRFAVALIGLFTEIGTQDLPHPAYQRLINAIEQTARRYNAAMIFAAGHDHSLQVFGAEDQQLPQYRIVSGAANSRMVTGVGDNENTLFAAAREGFIELEIFAMGVRLSVYTINQTQPVFSRWLWRDQA